MNNQSLENRITHLCDRARYHEEWRLLPAEARSEVATIRAQVAGIPGGMSTEWSGVFDAVDLYLEQAWGDTNANVKETYYALVHDRLGDVVKARRREEKAQAAARKIFLE